jgi:hypothetical protein
MAGQSVAATSCRWSTVTSPGAMPKRLAVSPNDGPSSVSHCTFRGRGLAPSHRPSVRGDVCGRATRWPKQSPPSCIARSQPHVHQPLPSPGGAESSDTTPRPTTRGTAHDIGGSGACAMSPASRNVGTVSFLSSEREPRWNGWKASPRAPSSAPPAPA